MHLTTCSVTSHGAFRNLIQLQAVVHLNTMGGQVCWPLCKSNSRMSCDDVRCLDLTQACEIAIHSGTVNYILLPLLLRGSEARLSHSCGAGPGEPGTAGTGALDCCHLSSHKEFTDQYRRKITASLLLSTSCLAKAYCSQIKPNFRPTNLLCRGVRARAGDQRLTDAQACSQRRIVRHVASKSERSLRVTHSWTGELHFPKTG